MASPRPWTVLAHDPITQLDDNLWTVEGDISPGAPLRRRMAVVRLSHGGLLIHNAIALSPPAQQELETFGKPILLVVPNGMHRLDAHAYKQRYPQLQVYCPRESARAVAHEVPVDGHYDSFPTGAAVRVVPLRGLKNGEAAFVITSAGGTSLLFNDALFNMPHRGGFGGLVLKLLGSTGGLKIPPVARLLMIRDVGALKGHLRELAAEPRLRRLIVSHGNVLDTDPAGALERVALA